MIGRFITLVALFIVGVGLALHFQVDLPPILSWVGHLPGDLVLRHEEATIFLPFSTAVAGSVALMLLGFMIVGKS